MAKGNRIIVTPCPRGRFERIIVVGTPKPGTIMYPTAAAEAQGGARSMEPAGTTGGLGMGADGDMIPICVLLSFIDCVDCPPGRTVEDAYVTGENGAVYYPVDGEELNVLFGNAAGTADDVTLGMKLIVDDGTGKVIPTTGTPKSEPFVAREAYTDPTADRLLHVVYSSE